MSYVGRNGIEQQPHTMVVHQRRDGRWVISRERNAFDARRGIVLAHRTRKPYVTGGDHATWQCEVVGRVVAAPAEEARLPGAAVVGRPHVPKGAEEVTGSLAANAIADGWSTEGLPGHLVQDVPLTAEVTMRDRTGVHEVTMLVQLERDGVPLTMKDKLPGWTAGEREGWLPR